MPPSFLRKELRSIEKNNSDHTAGSNASVSFFNSRSRRRRQRDRRRRLDTSRRGRIRLVQLVPVSVQGNASGRKTRHRIKAVIPCKRFLPRRDGHCQKDRLERELVGYVWQRHKDGLLRRNAHDKTAESVYHLGRELSCGPDLLQRRRP